MTVEELINYLKLFPMDVEVVIDSGDCTGLYDEENVYQINELEGQKAWDYGEIERVLIK